MSRPSDQVRLDRRVLDALQAHGPMTVTALRDRLRVRRKTLFAVLAELCADGSVQKGNQQRIGADSRPRRITTYSVPVLRKLSGQVWVSDASGGGSRPHDDGSRDASESDAAADLEFSEAPRDCPGCSLAGGGPDFCGSCKTASRA